jgi:transposase
MYFATKPHKMQILIWLIWAIACLAFLAAPESGSRVDEPFTDRPMLVAAVTHEPQRQYLFPWQPKRRFRKWAWRRYRDWQRARRRAVWIARLAWLALTGALTLAQLVDLVTYSQLRRHLGALPVLYALLETLQVRQIINRHCPTLGEVDHGTVALVLILNRLMAPRPLYQVADWLACTVLVHVLGIPAEKFNDDRLARSLDAISQHTRDIWQDVVHQALIRAEIDLSLIFYDLTAFVVHGNYTNSQHADFGFAHNTPMGKRKIKEGLNVSADGDIPAEYKVWSGRTADKATVQENMARLCRLFKQHGWSADEVMLVGDRANLNDELALAYEDHGLRYLAGLQPYKTVHRELVTAVPTPQFYAHPLTEQRGPGACWGVSCRVVFKHEGRQVIHRGLVILSGPMRTAQRRSRAAHFRALRQELRDVQTKIGRPYYRSVEAVQQRANTRLKNSPVGKLMRAEAYLDEQDQICLRWWIDRYALWQVMERDGRYLLVTNDWSLSPQRMLALYRQKDGVERRFKVSKSELKVSPIYLHKDNRIEAMLLVNMLALLAYSLLERQVRQGGLQMTTQRIIEKLESLDVIETHCWDGSHLYRLNPMDDEQAALLQALAHVLTDLRLPRWPHRSLSPGEGAILALPPPFKQPLTI